jgi:hypothetical protein
VISYFKGTFQSQSEPAIKQQVEFQLRLTRFENQRIYLLIDHWNEEYGSSETVILRPYHNGADQGYEFGKKHLKFYFTKWQKCNQTISRYAQLFELTRGNLINTTSPVEISLYRQRKFTFSFPSKSFTLF